jgi:hypothetical protein
MGATAEEQARRRGLRWGSSGDGRLTREVGGIEVLGRWVRAGEQPEEQPRVPIRGSREFTALVWSSGRCWGVQRGTGVAVCGGSMMPSTTTQWR